MDETHERRPAIAATPEDLEGTPAPRRDRDRPKDIGSAEGWSREAKANGRDQWQRRH